MRSKFILLLILYLPIVACFTIIQSCIFDFTYDAKICDIYFRAGDETDGNLTPDTFLTKVEFVISSKQELNCINEQKFTLIPVCFATKRCADWKNKLVISSFQLSFDKLVVLSGDTLFSGYDLFQSQEFKNLVQIGEYKNCDTYDYSIIFPAELLSKMAFEAGFYTVRFFCKTDDERSFARESQVVFGF